jgi:hypothetical protein
MIIKYMQPDGMIDYAITATAIRSLANGNWLVYCQDRLAIVNSDYIVIKTLDIIEFIEDYI